MAWLWGGPTSGCDSGHFGASQQGDFSGQAPISFPATFKHVFGPVPVIFGLIMCAEVFHFGLP
jgi:hypothetical protein